MNVLRSIGLIVCCVFAMHAKAQLDLVLNQGQWPTEVIASADIRGGKLWFTPFGFRYQLLSDDFFNALHPPGNPNLDSIKGHVYDVKFHNASFHQVSGEKKKTFYYNYFLGQNESFWRSNVPVYEMFKCENIYPFIDLKYYSIAGNLKYDLHIQPNGNTKDIRWSLDGVDTPVLKDGQIVISTSLGTIVEKAPFAYQIIQGKIVEVECKYVLKDGYFSFDVGKYNKAVELIIDPEVAFSTFIGATASNFGFTACNDSEDNLISGAAVFNAGYPTTPGAFSQSFIVSSSNYMDVAISKFSSDGSQLLYSTYLGGNNQETPHSIVADDNDNFIVFGVTGSPNFPITTGVLQPNFIGGTSLAMNDFFTSSHPFGCDLFITKFNPSGTLLRSTYVGGPENDGLNYGDQLFYNYGDAFRGEVNVDELGRIYVATVTRGQFPMQGPGYNQTFGEGFTDGLVFSIDSDLSSMINSTYVGGFDLDATYAVEFNEDGNLIVAGGTRSPNFQVSNTAHQGAYSNGVDGYVLVLDQDDLSILAGTFIGTDAYDQAYFVQTDPQGNIYVLGQSRGNFPITPGCWGQPNSGQFIRKYNASLSTLEWSTVIGRSTGAIDISPTAFLVSDCNQIFFSGWGGTTNSSTCQFIYDCYATTSSTSGMPISPDAIQPNTDGSDFYLCVLSPDAQDLIYASFLGGAQSAEHVDGGTSRFAKNGTVYQSVCAGCQSNSDFPTSPNAWSATNNSLGCNMAVFRFNLGQIQAEVEVDGPTQICEDTPANFLNLSQGGNQYIWVLGDGTESTEFNVSHIYDEPGTYEVMLIVNEETECLIGDTASITITILPGVNPFVEPISAVCPGTAVELNASGSENLFWLPHPSLSDTDIPNPIAIADEFAIFTLIDSNFCEIDTLFISIPVFSINTNVNGPFTICQGNSVTLSASGGASYQWSPPTALNSTVLADVVATPNDSIVYSVVITTADNCVDTLQVDVNVDYTEIGGNIYDTISLCVGSAVALPGPSANSWLWTPSTTLSNPNVQFPSANPTSTTTYFVTFTNTCAEGTDQVTVEVIYPLVIAEGDTVVCFGKPVPLRAFGAVEYEWQPAMLVENRFEANVVVAPFQTTTFKVLGIDENGCAATDSVLVVVLPEPDVFAGPDLYFEAPGSVVLLGSAYGHTFSWSPDIDISCTTCPNPTVWPSDSTVYILEVVDANGCRNQDAVSVVPLYPLYVPNTVTPNGDGINDVFRVEGVNIRGFKLTIFNRWGDLIFESFDPKEPWVPGLNGYYVQDGVYTWVLEYESIERRKQVVGHVTVLR